MTESTALARRTGVASIAERARGAFNAAQVDLIRRTVAKDCNDDELAMFLELCVRYELDPFAGQIYAAKMPGEDGTGGRVSIIVGRDGFLTIAERHPDYEGHNGDVVHANDDFKKLPVPVQRPDGFWTQIEHTYTKPSERGEIVGAWVEVYRTGRPPFYFYADMAEYKPRSERKLRYSPWKVQTSVMIYKVALTTGLRHCFNITGLIGEEEASRQLHDPPPPEVVDWGDDPEVAERLRVLFGSANAQRDGAFRPAKVKMLLDGVLDEIDRKLLVEDLEKWHKDRGLDVLDPVHEDAPVEAEVEVEDADYEHVDDEPDTLLDPEAIAEAQKIEFGEPDEPPKGD
jgi:phage recombination protein Bet